MNTLHKRYFWLMIAGFGATLFPILALNMILVNSTLEERPNTVLASQWQQTTHGVVSAPSALETDYFKLLRLQDRLTDINTVVLGASTSFGITQDMFPTSMQIYNFSKNGISLGMMIGEAEYLLDHSPNVKWIFIPLDWSVGFVYESGSPRERILFPISSASEPERATWLQRVRDSLSYPRIEGLFHALKIISSSSRRLATFHQLFLQASSDEYTCANGDRAKDFDLQHLGSCRGFRYDGSFTFNSMDRVGNPQQLIMLALTSQSKYTKNLLETQGLPNQDYLRQMAILAHRAEASGGGIVFFMPPLLSGMEKEFMQHPKWSGYLGKTKESLSTWAKNEHLLYFDAGQSEKFGCTANEFTDEHHATQTCYQKVFSALWRDSTILNKVSANH